MRFYARKVKFKFVYFLLALTALITFIFLGQIPRAFYFDEAAFGYYGHSILKYGLDEFGNKFPLYFKSIGDYKYPLYAYLTALPTLFFGLSVFSARFLSALSGVSIILYIFLYAKENKLLPKSFPLLALSFIFLLSSPWYLLFARTAREATLGLALVVWGLYFYDKKNFILSTLLFILSGFTYSAYRLLIPLLLLGKKPNLVFIIVLAVFAVLTLDNGSRLRAANVINSISPQTSLSAQSESNEIGLATNDSKLGWLMARAFHNKYALKFREYSEGYLKHFDPSYLFATSNHEFMWYKVPAMGLLPLFAIVPFLLGIIKAPKYLIYVFLVSAIPAALTIEIPNPIRHLTGFVPASIFILIGIKILEEKINQYHPQSPLGHSREGGNLYKWIPVSAGMTSVLFVLLTSSSIFAYKQFFINREYQNQTYSNQGFKEVVEYIGQNQDKYDQIILEGDPYIYFLFWGQKYGFTQDKIKTLDRQWGSVQSLGKLQFLSEEPCPKNLDKNILYVCRGNVFPPDSKIVFKSFYNSLDPSYTLIVKE